MCIRDSFWPDRAGEYTQHVGPAQVVSQPAGFASEGKVEFGGTDLGALEPRPGIVVGIDRVDPTDEVDGQAACFLEPVECLKRRGGDDTAKVEDDGRKDAIGHHLQLAHAPG
jgi:hypothetical protein